MAYTVMDASEVEPVRGVFRQMRRALGVTAFGINQVDLPPGAEGHEHDETKSSQEEVYVFLSGTGVMRVDGDEIEVRRGRYVFVAPGSMRQPVAGPDGLSWVCVGSVPNGPYVAREPF
jgi:quercetin dioxygenase-like cupin family protein